MSNECCGQMLASVKLGFSLPPPSVRAAHDLCFYLGK